MTVLGTVVETKELVSTVLASLAAGIGVTAAFSIMIVGAARFADLREDRPLLAAGAAILTLLGFAITAAGIVIGIIVMTTKS